MEFNQIAPPLSVWTAWPARGPACLSPDLCLWLYWSGRRHPPSCLSSCLPLSLPSPLFLFLPLSTSLSILLLLFSSMSDPCHALSFLHLISSSRPPTISLYALLFFPHASSHVFPLSPFSCPLSLICSLSAFSYSLDFLPSLSQLWLPLGPWIPSFSISHLCFFCCPGSSISDLGQWMTQ